MPFFYDYIFYQTRGHQRLGLITSLLYTACTISLKAAIVQFKASTYKHKNLEKILGYIKKASERGRADVCAFPEFMMMYTNSSQTPRELAQESEPITGDFVSLVSQAAKEHRIQVVGSIYETSPKNDRVYDTVFVTDKRGRVISTYRKIHLYDALGFKESTKMAPGSEISKPVKTAIGKMGMMVCYDLRFPEMSRSLAAAGSEVLVAPSAWVGGYMKKEHWRALNCTRAIENGCYMLAPDQIGNIYSGHSMAVDPYGKILLDMKQKEGIGYVKIDLSHVRETRKSLPLLKNRRTDIYPSLRV